LLLFRVVAAAAVAVDVPMHACSWLWHTKHSSYSRFKFIGVSRWHCVWSSLYLWLCNGLHRFRLHIDLWSRWTMDRKWWIL
jgi:hypothetical protein